MPGVNSTTSVRKGPASGIPVEGVTYFVTGITERGPIDKAVTIHSMADYAKTFGDRTSYSTVYDDVRTHFEEGGVEVVIARLVGASPTAGTHAFVDKAGSPLTTLTINAKYVGPWSTRVSITIIAGGPANTFTVIVLLDGSEVERYRNLISPADAVTRMALSNYVTVVNAGSATTAPNNNPANVSAIALSAGADNRGGLVAADYVTRLTAFDDSFGSGAVAIPGFTSDQIGAGLQAHCKTYNRVGLTSTAAGSTPDQAKTAALALQNTIGSGGEYLGFFYPAIQIPNDLGGFRTIGPEGYVAACRARAVTRAGGPWQAPAGANAVALWVTGLDYQIDRPTGDDLDASQVSAIRSIARTIRLYGWRSLAAPADVTDYPLLSIRDLLNFVQVEADNALEDFVFDTVDAGGQQAKRMEGVLVGIVDPIAQANGLYPNIDKTSGDVLDPGYSVSVTADLNSLLQQKMSAILGLRPAPTATIIELQIIKAALNASLNV